MGIRESLNEKPAITTGVTIGIIVLALAIMIYQFTGGSAGASSTAGKVFFSDDDGKTFFPDDSSKVPPCDHNGKQAVRAYVFSCNGTKSVVYLERYTPEAKRRKEAALTSPKSPVPVADALLMTGVEIKAPGERDWIKQTDPRAGKIMQPKCSDPEPVSP